MSANQTKKNYPAENDWDYMGIANEDYNNEQGSMILNILTQLRNTEKVKKLVLPKTDIIINFDNEKIPFPYVYTSSIINEDAKKNDDNYSPMNNQRKGNESLLNSNLKESNVGVNNDMNKKNRLDLNNQKKEEIYRLQKEKEHDIILELSKQKALELEEQRELEKKNDLLLKIEHEKEYKGKLDKEIKQQKDIELQQQKQLEQQLEIEKKKDLIKKSIYNNDDDDNNNYQSENEASLLQKQKELDNLKEISKQKELHLITQRELALQKELELENYRQLVLQRKQILEKQKELEKIRESELKEIEKHKELDKLFNFEKQKEIERQEEINRLKAIEDQQELIQFKEIKQQKKIENQKELEACNEENKLKELQKQSEFKLECDDEEENDDNQNSKQNNNIAPETENNIELHIENDYNINNTEIQLDKIKLENDEAEINKQTHKPQIISTSHKNNQEDHKNRNDISIHTQDIDNSSKISSDNESKPKSPLNTKEQSYYPLYTIVPNLQSQIEVIINTINLNDQKYPSLSDSYPIITSFNQEEPTLLLQIPLIQQNIIDTEGNAIFSIRRKGFLINQHLKTSFKFNTLYLNQLQNCTESYITRRHNILQQHPPIMNHLPTNRNILNLLNQIEEDNNHKSPIGSIDDIISFFYKYPSARVNSFMEQYAESYDNWRHIHNDGNSFHRAFMFALIEDYIFNNKINEIVFLINELSTRAHLSPLKDLFTNKRIKLSTTIMLLKGIIVQLLEEKNDIAYQLFCTGYQLDSNAFDLTLIGFLRGIIQDYMKEIYLLLDNEGKLNGQTINNNAKESIDAIGYYGIEADFFHLCIAAYVFNVNIEMLWIEGDMNNPNFDIVKIDDQDKAFLPTITLGYVYSHYIKLYQKNMKKYEKIIYSNVVQKDQGIQQLTFISTNDKDMIQCPQCSNKSVVVLFLKKGFSICYQCLKNHVDIIITNRAKSFVSSHFLSLEYHTRDIPLIEGYELNEQEYAEIYQSKGIVNDLQQRINQMCFLCLNMFEIKMLYALKCDCQYCQECIEKKKKINNASNVARNDKSSLQKVFCECFEEFSNTKVLALYQVRKKDDILNKESVN